MIVMPSYWSWISRLPKSVCENVVSSYYKEDASIDAVVGATVGGEVRPETRVTKVCWIPPEEHISSVLFNHVLLANHKAGWHLDVDYMESVQLAKYEPGGHYTWHTDTNLMEKMEATQRKLSVVVLLSDPADYEGGGLEFYRDSPTPVTNLQGSIYVFPSLVEHRVVPITKGVRYSLAGWCRGPAFR